MTHAAAIKMRTRVRGTPNRVAGWYLSASLVILEPSEVLEN
jgi:hypothetical protein